jgi:hypothetical protein
MKVIEAGRPQRGWAREEYCTGYGNQGGGCGAKLLVEQGDLYKTQSHCRDETETFITFQCMACGVQTDIKGVPSFATSDLIVDNHRGRHLPR